MKTIQLVGMDFGSTTMHFLVGQVEVIQNCVTGRAELGGFHEIHSAPPCITPFRDRELDLVQIKNIFSEWKNLLPQECKEFSAIITGLAAKADNFFQLKKLLQENFNDLFLIYADCPRYESWLAFMGGAHAISVNHPDSIFVNLDIGGGTTNIALGKNGEALGTGNYFIGARHFEIDPKSSQLIRISTYGQKILKILKMNYKKDDSITSSECERIACYYIDFLETILWPENNLPNKYSGEYNELNESLTDAPLHEIKSPFIPIFSGGVGELIYRLCAGEEIENLLYGDLGVYLAREILKREKFSKHLKGPHSKAYIPAQRGRATLCGLTLNSKRISGSTCFIGSEVDFSNELIPLIGKITSEQTSEEIKSSLQLGLHLRKFSAFYLKPQKEDYDSIRSFGVQLKSILESLPTDQAHGYVFLCEKNLGLTLGHYISNWGKLKMNVMVIDEIENFPNGLLKIKKMNDTLNEKRYLITYVRFGNESNNRS